MKIVMIGNTNVGKTTYMASLYGIMQQQVEGFSLKAVNTNDHARLYELAQAIAHDHYPSATDQRGEYDFFYSIKVKTFLLSVGQTIVVEQLKKSKVANKQVF